MIWWGGIWGTLLGIAWPGSGDFWMLGGLLGLLAGWTLRFMVRRELARAMAAQPARAAEQVVAPPPVDVPAAAPVFVPVAAAPAPEPAPEPAPAAPPGPPGLGDILVEGFRSWLFGGNTIVRMGVLVLFVGLAFLAKYAIDNSLLPPELRLAGIAAAGIGLFYAGIRLRRNEGRLAYALTLQGAGVAVLYLTVFAAFRLYDFLPAGAAFIALGLVCAFSAAIALAQNAQVMAFIGFAGGFAAPLLVSTGQGDHVGLFSYYLLLGVAIAAIAWARAWRALNLLGFFATFGVATAWGTLKYRPEDFATTEPFLVAFFLVYVAAAVLYATRHSLAAKRAVDATLVFGVPIVAFGLQAGLVRDIELGTALSALAVGGFYLALAAWMVRRQDLASRWLAECFAALGLGFVTLAVPLALDARWTSAVWAVEGAGVYWMGRRQDRWLARAAGLALQVFAAFAFLNTVQHMNTAVWPIANPVFIGSAMLAAAALALAWWSREVVPAEGPGLRAAFVRLEAALPPMLFWIGFLWILFALHAEIDRAPLDAQGVPDYIAAPGLRANLKLLAWVLAAFTFHHLALPARARPWTVAATPAWFVLPVLLAGALLEASWFDHVFVAGGWLLWPVMLALHAVMLRRLDTGRPALWWPWVHAGGVWLLVLLLGNALVFAVGRAQLWQTAWAAVVLLVSATVVLLALSLGRWWRADGRRWPLDRFARAYLWMAAAPLAAGVALGALVVAVHSDGNAKPLPYVPLLNPTDLAVGLALAACTLWLLRLRRCDIGAPAPAQDARWPLVLAGIGFIALNTVWLRVAHHYAGVSWDTELLFHSFLVQAGVSILWTLLAFGLMVTAFRRGWRGAWMLGAGLLGATVAKLFLVDLSNRGGSERIVVFIAVGVLMLVVGYFAPIPPAARTVPEKAMP